MTRGEPKADVGARLPRADRRDALIDAATEIVASGDIDAISIESVAERAGVSRPLVYKHFANRTEILAAVYQRESELLQREIGSRVQEAPTLEDKLRAYVAGCLRAQADRGATFEALRSAGVRNEALRQDQRRRDRATVRYFAHLAMEEFALDEKDAREAVSVLLGSITAVLAQWRRRPTKEHATQLEDIFVRMGVAGLRALPKA